MRLRGGGDEDGPNIPDPEPKGNDVKSLGSELSNDSDDDWDNSNADGDERKRIGRNDGDRICGHTRRIETGGGSKLFKMTRPEKYSNEKDNDRKYCVCRNSRDTSE